ncbi:ATP synthase subunit gamma, mitochondrial [Aphelenchoides besseyi]|nr:ATP synthase subunit gamma, mitochondrial [Aphelenchoides besseyi]
MTALPTIAFRGELEKMESAAKLLLFQETTYSQRREAESYFMSLRDANLSPELCRQIIENTGEPYVIFQLAQCLTVQLLRNWNSCTSDELKAICKYLLEFPLSHPNLPSFAIAELFKSAAVIYKRGANWNAEMILEPVSRLLQSTDDAMQTMGLRMIEAFCFELSTVGRTAVPITFQVHKIAKKNFEEKVLKKLMELSLGFLFRFVGTLDINDHVNICDRFLKVAVLVLQWDFPTSVVSSFLRKNSNSPNKSAALRPPPSWSDLFQDEKLLPFFFELHKRVRGNQQLAQNSLQCIMQLAAVMGTVLDRREKSGADIRASTTPQPHDLYVQRFISALIDCFADCHPHELLPFTTAMHRIFSHHPMPIFKRFPRELITNFIKFVVHWARTLAAPAMHQDKENDEYGLVDALTNVLTCWSILLRSTTFAPDVQSLIAEQNNLVIESFLKAVLAPPYGERPANQMETHEQNEDDELDDYRHYAIILTDIGVFCRSSIEAFTQFVIKSFNERINQRSIIAQSGAVSEAERYLWFEDMHWMLLMISSFLQDSDRDIALRLDRGYKAKEWTLIDTPAFFSQCITQLDSFQAPNNADPLTIICGMVAHWTGILLNAIETQGPASSFVSPEICRSTVRTFASTIQFLTSMTDDSSSAFFDDQTPTDLGPLPTLPTTGEFSAGLVDLIIRLCFAVFRAYPGEKQLCKTAVCFLLQESEKRAQYIAKSPILYEQLASISLEKLPSRADFMTCLVNVGSNLSSSQERSQMNDLILQPLANRFLAQAAAFQQNNSEMIMNVIHLLECFAGVARGATKQSARLLYALEIILPLLSPTSLQFPNLSSAFYRLLQHISETSPIVFLKMDQVLTERLIVCFNWAIEVSFGMEALKCSLSTINHVARAASTLPNAQKHLFVNLIYRILMNKIFEMAYHATATIDKEVYGPTRHVVYSLILADKRARLFVVDKSGIVFRLIGLSDPRHLSTISVVYVRLKRGKLENKMGALAKLFFRRSSSSLNQHDENYQSAFTYNTEREFANEFQSIDLHYSKSVDDRPNYTTERSDAKISNLSFQSIIELFCICLSVVLLVCTLPFSLFFSLKFISSFERLVIFRMGKIHQVHESGTVLVLPCVDKAVKVDIRTTTLQIPKLQIITADRGIVDIDTVVFVRITDPLLAVCSLQERDKTIRDVAYTTLYNRLVRYHIADLTHARTQDRIIERVKDALNEFVKGSGVEITELTFTDVQVLKSGENQTIGIFQQLLASDMGKQLIGAFGSQAAEMLSQAATESNHSQWPVFNPMAETPSTTTVEPRYQLSNTELDSFIEKIRQCCDASMVAKVGKRFRIQCELNGVVHHVDLNLRDGTGYCGIVSPNDGTKSDVTFCLTYDTLIQLIRGEVAWLSAYLGGQVRVAGNIQDAMGLGHLVERAKELKLLSSATEDMRQFLQSIRNKVQIGVVSGSDLVKITEQLADNAAELRRSYDYVFTENGLVSFHGEEQLPAESIGTKLGDQKLNEIIDFCLHYIADLKGINKRGTFIEYRRGMLNVSPIGRNCSQQERDEFVVYDAENKVREKFVDALREHFSSYGLTFSIGGQISIDVFPNGWDKTFCLQYLQNQFDEIHFFGDRTQAVSNLPTLRLDYF